MNKRIWVHLEAKIEIFVDGKMEGTTYLRGWQNVKKSKSIRLRKLFSNKNLKSIEEKLLNKH